MDEIARTVTLTSFIPEGLPGPEHFTIVDSPAPTKFDVPEGGLLLRVDVMSADPYLRSGCKSETRGGAIPRPMIGFVAGHVLESKCEGWVSGDFFGASLPFTTVQLLHGEALANTRLWKLTGLVNRETVSLGIGVLGMPGSTAYGGLIDILRPVQSAAKPEVIWVSGAAGAVGSMVGQLAKNCFGCTVIGSCGGPDKGALIKKKFGFDHAIDYKACANAEELGVMLKSVAPDGIDM